MSMILSRCSSPSILSCGAGASLAPLILRAIALYSVSISKVDLPPPETPVTQVNRPSGISAVMFLRLLPRALTTFSERRGVGGRRPGGGPNQFPGGDFSGVGLGVAVKNSTLAPGVVFAPWVAGPGAGVGAWG